MSCNRSRMTPAAVTGAMARQRDMNGPKIRFIVHGSLVSATQKIEEWLVVFQGLGEVWGTFETKQEAVDHAVTLNVDFGQFERRNNKSPNMKHRVDTVFTSVPPNKTFGKSFGNTPTTWVGRTFTNFGKGIGAANLINVGSSTAV